MPPYLHFNIFFNTLYIGYSTDFIIKKIIKQDLTFLLFFVPLFLYPKHIYIPTTIPTAVKELLAISGIEIRKNVPPLIPPSVLFFKLLF